MADNSFLILSRDKERMDSLRVYIHGLFCRQYGDLQSHRMAGYDCVVDEWPFGWCALEGCLHDCRLYDLGYWLQKDGMNDLLLGTYVFETVDNGHYDINRYGSKNAYKDGCGVLSCWDWDGDWYEGYMSDHTVVPSYLHKSIIEYFSE